MYFNLLLLKVLNFWNGCWRLINPSLSANKTNGLRLRGLLYSPHRFRPPPPNMAYAAANKRKRIVSQDRFSDKSRHSRDKVWEFHARFRGFLRFRSYSEDNKCLLSKCRDLSWSKKFIKQTHTWSGWFGWWRLKLGTSCLGLGK